MNIRRVQRSRRSNYSSELNREHHRATGSAGIKLYDISGFSFNDPNISFSPSLGGFVFPSGTASIEVSNSPMADTVQSAGCRLLIVSLVTGLPVQYRAIADDLMTGGHIMSDSWSDQRYIYSCGGFVGTAYPFPSPDSQMPPGITIEPFNGYFEPCIFLLAEKDLVGAGNVYPAPSPGGNYSFTPACSGDVILNADNNYTDGWAAQSEFSSWMSSVSVGDSVIVDGLGTGGSPLSSTFWIDTPGYIGNTESFNYIFDPTC